MAITPGFIVTQASAVLLVVLGVLVLAVRPRTRASVAFTAYAVGAGAGVFMSNLWQASLQSEGTLWAALVLQLTAGIALAVLLLAFPRPPPAWQQAAFWTATLALLAYELWQGDTGPLRRLQGSPSAIYAPLAVGSVLLALRFAGESDPRARTQLALMSGGTIPYLAMSTGDGLLKLDVQRYLPETVLLAAATILWVVNTARATTESHAARNVALLIPASMLVGMVARAIVGDGSIDDTGLYGIARIITFVVLSYAILRHRMLGLDVKLRFAISKSTLAAILLSVVFIASEGAQAVFGADKQWLGLVAGGCVVFAIAPLQRAADKLAEKAVPVSSAKASNLPPANDREERYRAAVWLALRDRRLTRTEEAELHRLAEALGLGGARAHEIITETEGGKRGRRS